MSEWFWVLWSVLAAILIVAEIFTSGFVLLWFGLGALAAEVTARAVLNAVRAATGLPGLPAALEC